MTARRALGLAGAAWLVLGGLGAAGAARAQTGAPRPARPELVPSDVGAILHRGVLTVAMAATDAPPFFYVRDGRLAGIDVRMSQQMAQELKVSLRIDRSARSFNEVVEIVARGEADLGISKLSHTLTRSLTVHFSDPYMTFSHALLLNRIAFARLLRDRPISQVIRSFNGSLAVLAHSSFADFAPRHFPQARIVPFPSWDAAVAAVRRGEVIGAYRDEFEVRRILLAEPALALTLRTVTLKDLSDDIAVAVGARSPTLLAFVNKFIDHHAEPLTVESALNELRR